jgi:predicted RecA/RadA family phage recombinase
MMKKLYDGNVLIMIALVATAVGDVVEFADSIGIAQTAGEVGESVSVDTVGVYELPSADADAIAVGDVLYWDSANGELTTSDGSGANVRAGVSWSAKAGSATANIGVKIG